MGGPTGTKLIVLRMRLMDQLARQASTATEALTCGLLDEHACSPPTERKASVTNRQPASIKGSGWRIPSITSEDRAPPGASHSPQSRRTLEHAAKRGTREVHLRLLNFLAPCMLSSTAGVWHDLRLPVNNCCLGDVRLWPRNPTSSCALWKHPSAMSAAATLVRSARTA